MHFDISKNPMGMLEVYLDNNESITAEAGALVFIKGNIEVKTKFRQGGILKNLKVSFLGNESFFVNEYIAREMDVLLG